MSIHHSKSKKVSTLEPQLLTTTGVTVLDNEYRFQRALNRSMQQVEQNRTDCNRREYQQLEDKTDKTSSAADHITSFKGNNDLDQDIAFKQSTQEDLLISTDAMITTLLPRGERQLTPFSEPHHSLSHRTSALVDRCFRIIEQQIRCETFNALATIDLPENTLGGARITLQRVSTGWYLTATVPNEAAKNDIFAALPSLRNRFMDNHLGSLHLEEVRLKTKA